MKAYRKKKKRMKVMTTKAIFQHRVEYKNKFYEKWTRKRCQLAMKCPTQMSKKMIK